MEEQPTSPTSPAAEAPKKSSPIKSLIMLVICCGGFFWAYKTIRQEMQPTADLSRLMRSSELAERIDGARQLGEVKPENLQASVAILIAAQSDSDDGLRAMLAWALGNDTLTAMTANNKAVGGEACQALLKALGDQSEVVRAAAADAFERIVKASKPETFPTESAPVITALVGLMNDPAKLVRKNSGLTLAAFGSIFGIEPPPSLLDGLAKLEQADSRAQVALTLGSFKTGIEPIVKALTLALKDTQPEVRSNAAASLRKFGPDAAPALSSLIPLVDDPFVPPVVPPPKPTLFVAVKASGPPPGEAPPVDPATQAVKTIGQIVEAQIGKGETPPAEAMTALLMAFKSSRDVLKDAAAGVFQKLRKGASAIVPELIVNLTESIPDPDSRFGPMAASTLGDVAPESAKAGDAIAALISALDAKTPATRSNAIIALGRFGPAASAALPKLKEIGDANPDLAASIKTASDRIEGKIPTEAPQRKGGRRGGGGGGPRAKGA